MLKSQNTFVVIMPTIMWRDPRGHYSDEYRIVTEKMRVIAKSDDGQVRGGWKNPVIVKKPDGAPDIPFSDIRAEHAVRIVFTGELGRVEVWVDFPERGEYRYKLKCFFKNMPLF